MKRESRKIRLLTWTIAMALACVGLSCAKLKGADSDEPSNKVGDTFGVADNGGRGLVGWAYDLSDLNALPTPTLVVADLANRTPLPGKILFPTINIPNRPFNEGFPSVRELTTWFGVKLEGKFIATQAGDYRFRVTSDDGSLLYLNESLIVDNDGGHSERAKDSEVLSLAAGSHNLSLEYFQGPPEEIALQFYVLLPGASTYIIVPPELIERPSEN